MTDLFDPCEFNGIRLQNRIALSPLTRTRSNDAGEAGPLQALYYAQRATAGLLITEGTQISPEGNGLFSCTASTRSDAQDASIVGLLIGLLAWAKRRRR